MPASSCAIGVPARSPCPCSEAVADEAQVGLDLLHRRPVRLKADHAIADLPERFEAPVVIVERPIVQIAADQASAAGDGTAGDGHVEPVDGGLAHLGADPELARHRQRHIVQLGRQLHARAAAIALEPQPATHVGAVVLALHTQRRGGDLPASTFAPADDLAGQLDLVHHAKAGRPIETQRGVGRGVQLDALRIAIDGAAQATDARRIAHRQKPQLLDLALRAQCAARLAGDLQVGHAQLRFGQAQPAPQGRRQLLAQGGRCDQARGIHMPAHHRVAAPAGNAQPVQALQLRRLAQAQ